MVLDLGDDEDEGMGIFPRTREKTVQDYSDFLIGINHKKYFFSEFTDKLLDEFGLDSATQTANVTFSDTSFTKIQEASFDIKIESPTVLGGLVIAKVSWDDDSTAGNTTTTFITVNIKKGTTSISSGNTSEVIDQNDDEGTNTELLNFNLTKTSFSKGDTLRVTLEYWGKITAGAAVDSSIRFGDSNKFIFIPFVSLDEL